MIETPIGDALHILLREEAAAGLAAGRFFAKYLSGLILLIGFIMVWDNLLNMFLQPWVGARSDRTRSRLGRRKPVLAASMGMLAATNLLASLAGTLLLCAAIAALTTTPRLVASVLGLNALLHLLLDATEQKWGNGVHLLAPFSWRMKWGITS